MSINDLYWLGAFVVAIILSDIILGNLRAGIEEVNNSSAGITGALKKSMLLVLIIFMTCLLFIANTFMETTAIITMITTAYTGIISALGYHEAQSALANIQMVYPDLNISDGLNKFFNVQSEKENKLRKLSSIKFDPKD